METDPFSSLRQMMVQIITGHLAETQNITGVRDIDPVILETMESVPRHEFVPAEMRPYAHADGPHPMAATKPFLNPL